MGFFISKILMCLLLLAYRINKKYPLIIASNRDEYYNRPTQKAHFWRDHPEILAGRDKKYGGTWLGITRSGKVGVLTNYRNPNHHKSKLKSRGLLLNKYLTNKLCNSEYNEYLQTNKDYYNGYNLLFSNNENFYWYSNIKNRFHNLLPGIYGLSNHLLDTPWPKVERGKKMLQKCLNNNQLDDNHIMKILKNNSFPEDSRLPDTGIGLKYERVLSPIFIISPVYGTRSSTVIKMDKHGEILFREDTYNHKQKIFSTNEFSFQI